MSNEEHLFENAIIALENKESYDEWLEIETEFYNTLGISEEIIEVIWHLAIYTVYTHNPALEYDYNSKAIPIDIFYKMIANALADTKKENWLPEECPYEYFDGNRNAIHCMLDILCGDKDGDHDTFWDNYQNWEEENGGN